MALPAPYYMGLSSGVGLHDSAANTVFAASGYAPQVGSRSRLRNLMMAAIADDPSKLTSNREDMNMITGLRRMLMGNSPSASNSSSTPTPTTPAVPGTDPTATFSTLLTSANTAASSDPYLQSVVNSIAGAGEAAGNRAARSYQTRTGRGAGTAAGEGYAGIARLAGISQGADAANRARLGQRNDFLSNLSAMSESALTRQQQQNLAQQANNQWLLRFIIGNAFGGPQDNMGGGTY